MLKPYSFERLNSRNLLSGTPVSQDVPGPEDGSVIVSQQSQPVRQSAVSEFPIAFELAPDGTFRLIFPDTPAQEPAPIVDVPDPVAEEPPPVVEEPAPDSDGGDPVAETPAAPGAQTPQAASIQDRDIVLNAFEEFQAATSVPSISPALVDAGPSDLVVTYDELLGPTDLTAVVLKPRPNGTTYQIPIPPADVDLYRFLEDHLELAAEQGVGEILFPANQLLEIVPPTTTGSHLNFEDMSDVTVDLNGSTIRLTQATLGLKIEGAERLVLKNGTVHGVGQLATVAKVVADTSEAGIRFEVLPEYRSSLDGGETPPELYTVGRAESVPGGGYRVAGSRYAEMFINRGASTNNFEYVDGNFVGTSPIKESVFQPGEFVWLLHQNNSGHGMLIDNEVANRDITIEDLDFVNIPGMTVVGEVVRGLHINNITVQKQANDPLSFLRSIVRRYPYQREWRRHRRREFAA